MPSPLTFNLALRSAVPSSLVVEPAFTLLYEDNHQALKHLIDNKTPLPLQNVVQNPNFMSFILEKERGPKLEYDNLRPVLSAMRPWMLASTNGQKLMDFYRTLLRLQGKWAVAAAEMITFDIYVKLIQVLYIDRDDDKLLTHIHKHFPNAQNKIASFTISDRQQFNVLITTEKDRLAKQTWTAADALFSFKTSDHFLTQHSKLVATIEYYEKKLKELRDKTARRRREHIAKRMAARSLNEATVNRQMGMSGMVPHAPYVERSVEEYVNEMRERYFNFNGEPAL